MKRGWQQRVNCNDDNFILTDVMCIVNADMLPFSVSNVKNGINLSRWEFIMKF